MGKKVKDVREFHQTPYYRIRKIGTAQVPLSSLFCSPGCLVIKYCNLSEPTYCFAEIEILL